jgi:hypothetical protein
MFYEFFTSNNIRVQVLEISVLLHKSAFIQAYIFLPTGLTLAKLDMTPEEYAQWGNDDTYIQNFICSKFSILGTPTTQAFDEYNNPVILTDATSVHNPNDVQTIQSLQSQLDEMKTKMEAITSMLLKTNTL